MNSKLVSCFKNEGEFGKTKIDTNGACLHNFVHFALNYYRLFLIIIKKKRLMKYLISFHFFCLFLQ